MKNVFLGLALALLTGCATTQPSPVLPDSEEAMCAAMDAQLHEKQAALKDEGIDTVISVISCKQLEKPYADKGYVVYEVLASYRGKPYEYVGILQYMMLIDGQWVVVGGFDVFTFEPTESEQL